MDTYRVGFQLEDVRKFVSSGIIEKPTVIHDKTGFKFYFDIRESENTLKKCVLITVKGARPREFKTARTYTRVLKHAGIQKWQVKKQQEL
jgi:hypothetical protein